MPNNPIHDEQLAELDRWREAAPVNKWAVGKSPRNGRVQVHNGQIQVCAVWSTFTNPAQGTAQYIAAMHNAYPALRQRLLDAESRLAEAERERDELRAKNAAKEDLIREWARYVHTPTGERDTTVAERFWKDIEARFFGGEFDSLRWLTDRDARMKREGAAEWLEKFVAIAAGLSTPVTLRILQAEANRLREGKNV